MSSCLNGGQTACGIDLDIIKSSSILTRSSHSSPSSSISESSHSPLAISARKPRTPRKRLNQTYNEAAVLLSTAYPNIFSTKDFSKPCKFIKPRDCSSFSFEESSAELLLPFPVEKPAFQVDPTAYEKLCSTDTEETDCCRANSSELCDSYEDFDTKSILAEEIEEGAIDSIMGNSSVFSEEEHSSCSNSNGDLVNFRYGYPMGLGLGLEGRFNFRFDMMRGEVAKAFRKNDGGNWWIYPIVDVGKISPRFNKVSSTEKKKKVEKLNSKIPSSISSKENSTTTKANSAITKENPISPKSSSTSSNENSNLCTKSSPKLLLKLNYDEVLKAWSVRGSPFSEDSAGLEFWGSDALAKLAQIDLFGDSGALREASVQRYKDKRRMRLFPTKIVRYQVRKVNADQRPRVKGRFIRRSNLSEKEKDRK